MQRWSLDLGLTVAGAPAFRRVPRAPRCFDFAIEFLITCDVADRLHHKRGCQRLVRPTCGLRSPGGRGGAPSLFRARSPRRGGHQRGGPEPALFRALFPFRGRHVRGRLPAAHGAAPAALEPEVGEHLGRRSSWPLPCLYLTRVRAKRRGLEMVATVRQFRGQTCAGSSPGHWTILPPVSKIENMKAIGYVRVSTDQQADRGVSLEAQTEKVRAMAVVKEADAPRGHRRRRRQRQELAAPRDGALARARRRRGRGRRHHRQARSVDALRRRPGGAARAVQEAQGQPGERRRLARYELRGGPAGAERHDLGRAVGTGSHRRTDARRVAPEAEQGRARRHRALRLSRSRRMACASRWTPPNSSSSRACAPCGPRA